MNKKRSIVNLSNKAVLITSKALKSEKGINVSTMERKSVKTPNMRCTEGIGTTPSSIPFNVTVFLPLICLFGSVKEYLSSQGLEYRFKTDLFVLLLYVGCFGVGRGVSVSKLANLLYNSICSTHVRNTLHKLDTLVSYGLIVCVKYRGINFYTLSIDAENLIKKSVSVKDMRELNKMVKDVL